MEEKKSTHWLDALSDGSAGLTTISSCMSVCDLQCNNYYKLVTAEIPLKIPEKRPPRLRVYKGNQVINDQALPGIASSVQSLYIDENEPKMPIIAVSVGPSIFFYRNMKAYFKYTIPSLMIEPLEQEIWRKLVVERQVNYEKLINDLKTMNFSQMSSLSQKLISLSESEREEFIRENSEPKLTRLSTIVCMTTIYKNIEEEKEPNCLIIVTEASDIFIMDIQNFGILHTARVCSFKATPDLISASGSYQNDYKIIISTREGSICILRKNWLEGREIVKLERAATSMSLLQIDQTIVVLSKSLMCYSKKGKMLWSLNMNDTVMCMCPVPLPHLGVSMICVALKNGLVQLYSQKNLIDQFQVGDTVLAMYFGKLGLEEQVLVLVTINGNLLIKILKRTADFSNPMVTDKKVEDEPSDMKIAIPKKSKIFVEQTVREKENAIAIHNIFQSELWRMRLEAAKVTVDILRTGDSTFSGDLQTPIKLLAQCDGLGPDFLLTLTLENISATKIVTNLSIIIHANPNHYKVDKQSVDLTPLVPGIPLITDFNVSIQITSENLLPPDMTLENSIIRVLIVKEKFAKPLIASTVVMPQPELQMLGTI
ncbi:hypothetical protein PVAND_003372 [Polypedilum vanderplanki]|uniref:Bardet-Biedl syndrome 1 protein n=1 Tax=Polypedilum vanderplanki TaxID=319348 RepID=A0A9J6BUC2_POLVA|nr:hypothetical protein PVAND_003372 [Polypedilum vanderplanki]